MKIKPNLFENSTQKDLEEELLNIKIELASLYFKTKKNIQKSNQLLESIDKVFPQNEKYDSVLLHSINNHSL
jgi:hypothetical protein